MRILGIDPGLNTTGYGIIQGSPGGLKLVEAGFIRTSAKDNLEKRLFKIHKELTQIIQKHNPDAVVLEKLYAHYKHPVTASLLGHARGIICLACSQNNAPLFEYAATRTKKAILGRGNASKLQIQQMVLNQLNLREKNSVPLDITDALSLAIAHSYIFKKDKVLKFQ